MTAQRNKMRKLEARRGLKAAGGGEGERCLLPLPVSGPYSTAHPKSLDPARRLTRKPRRVCPSGKRAQCLCRLPPPPPSAPATRAAVPRPPAPRCDRGADLTLPPRRRREPSLGGGRQRSAAWLVSGGDRGGDVPQPAWPRPPMHLLTVVVSMPTSPPGSVNPASFSLEP